MHIVIEVLLNITLKDYKGAIEDYTKAIDINPDHSNAYNNRGLSKYNLKDYRGSIEDYTKAIDIDPDHPTAYNNRNLARKDLKAL